MYAIQGAMAVRRERNKRKARRLSQLRRGSKSGSMYSVVIGEEEEDEDPGIGKIPLKTSSSLTAFHIGVIFILLGFIMIFSSLIGTNNLKDLEYSEEERAKQKGDWSKLLGVGVTVIIVGLLMVMVNRIITSREEEELARYVSRRLGRTRSGHALVRDTEPYHPKRRLSVKKGVSSNRSPRSSTSGKQIGGNGSLPLKGVSHNNNSQGAHESKKRSASHSHLPSVNVENELGGKKKVLASSSVDKIESDKLYVPSPSASYHHDEKSNEEPTPSTGRSKFQTSRKMKRSE